MEWTHQVWIFALFHRKHHLALDVWLMRKHLWVSEWVIESMRDWEIFRFFTWQKGWGSCFWDCFCSNREKVGFGLFVWLLDLKQQSSWEEEGKGQKVSVVCKWAHFVYDFFSFFWVFLFLFSEDNQISSPRDQFVYVFWSVNVSSFWFTIYLWGSELLHHHHHDLLLLFFFFSIMWIHGLLALKDTVSSSEVLNFWFCFSALE
jgi:hypothetical protein